MAETNESAVDRVRVAGVHAASVADLLAVGLSRYETDVLAAENLVRPFLYRVGSLANLKSFSGVDLASVTGLEEFEGLRAQALIELGRRMVEAGKGVPTIIDTPEDAAQLLEDLRHESKEHFVAILLSAKNKVLRRSTIHIGTLTESIVGAREVFREALRESAASVIVAHNHPSGDPTPSPEDIRVTRELMQAGKLLDIELRDHIIMGDKKWISLRRDRLM